MRLPPHKLGGPASPVEVHRLVIEAGIVQVVRDEAANIARVDPRHKVVEKAGVVGSGVRVLSRVRVVDLIEEIWHNRNTRKLKLLVRVKSNKV